MFNRWLKGLVAWRRKHLPTRAESREDAQNRILAGYRLESERFMRRCEQEEYSRLWAEDQGTGLPPRVVYDPYSGRYHTTIHYYDVRNKKPKKIVRNLPAWF